MNSDGRTKPGRRREGGIELTVVGVGKGDEEGRIKMVITI